MDECQSFRVRLRIRVGKALTTDESSITAVVAGRSVEIKPQDKNETLREAKWIVLTAGGFRTERDAQQFGEQLRTISDIVGICTRVGMNVGDDSATTCIDEDWARAIGLIQSNERIHPNIHGLIVIPDDGLSRFPLVNAQGTVTSDPAWLLESINELGTRVPLSLKAAAAGVRILNLALMSSEPLTQVILAISVIEELGQDEDWTDNQQFLLTRMSHEIVNSPGAGDEENEIADALKRSLHRIGLRQGVLRVFQRLELNHLKKEWDRIYSIRSGAFHGTRRISDSEMNELAQAAMTLCGRVVIALLRQDGISPPAIWEKYY